MLQPRPFLEEFDSWLSLLKDMNHTVASCGKSQVPKINAYKKNVASEPEKDTDALTLTPYTTKYCIDALVPYATKEDISISVEDSVLTIEVQAHQDKGVEDTSYIIREISRGSMKRAITLGELIDADSAVSTFENGVLHIEFDEKAPEIRAKKIAIS
jgi:HSP20 family molecular chaperone IbpA